MMVPGRNCTLREFSEISYESIHLTVQNVTGYFHMYLVVQRDFSQHGSQREKRSKLYFFGIKWQPFSIYSDITLLEEGW